MPDHKMSLESTFESALTDNEMIEGESNHSNIEPLRKLCMHAGLTHSSEALNELCGENPKVFRETLEFGIKSIDHYQTLMPLLEDAVLRIYSVAKNHPSWDLAENSLETEDELMKLLASNSREDQH